MMNTSRDPAAPVATRKKDGHKQLNRKRERERDRLNLFSDIIAIEATRKKNGLTSFLPSSHCLMCARVP
jgi:hypothetical protein